MPQFIVRIEPTNLRWFLGDTEDLATIRGGGILLLEIAQSLCEHFKPSDPSLNLTVQGITVNVISAGASEFMGHFTCEDWGTAQSIESQLLNFLLAHDKLRYSTFATSVQELEENHEPDQRFAIANEQTKMQLRRRQLQYPTVSLAGCFGSELAEALRPCDIDNKRPAIVDLPGTAAAADKNIASRATFARREKGRESKKYWKKFIPSWTLEEISSLEESFVPQGSTQRQEFGRLSGKIAVFYADGNKFGPLVRRLAQNAEQFGVLDKAMRNRRRELEVEIADWVDQDFSFEGMGKNEIGQLVSKRRVQTLLWGGDELIWVVPAWAGLRLAQKFFTVTTAWEESGKQLTHAAGLVFCSHKAPIRSIVELAKELAESVKDNRSRLVERMGGFPGESQHSPYGNALAYVVLESFDHLGRDFSAGRSMQRFKSLDEVDEIITSEELNKLVESINHLKSCLAKRRLHQLAQVMYHAPQPQSFDALFKRIVATSNSSISMEDFQKVIRKGDTELLMTWQHILNLWDYCFAESHQKPAQNSTSTGVHQS